MSSKLEQEIKNGAYAFVSKFKGLDRAVVVGAVLSFVPIFPACIIGVIISLANFILIRTKKLNRSNVGIVVVSIGVGTFFSLMWLIVFFWINPVDLFRAIGRQIFNHVENLFYWVFQVPNSKDIQAMINLTLGHGYEW